MAQASPLRLFREEDGDLEALQGKTMAVVGYGNLGRSFALNLRDSGPARVIVGSRSDDSFRQAQEDGFPVFPIAEATRSADVLFLLVPDEAIPSVLEREVGPNLKPGAALVFASGYDLAYGLISPPPNADVLMLAPRMLGETIRRLYVAGQGFASYVSVEQDATGQAWPLVLALARATGSLRFGAMALTAKEEADLDLFVEQAVGPWIGAAVLTAFQVGVEAGSPPEALLLELYMSREMSHTFRAMAEEGFFRSVRLHGYAAAFGGMVRSMAVDRDQLADMMSQVLEEIRSGSFARELQAEIDNGYPSRALLEEMISEDNPLTRAEENLRQRLGPAGG